MDQLQSFKNELFEVSARIDGNQILFDVEQVAKCLGITDFKNGCYYVRWNRVNNYLPLDSPLVAKGDLIPEPLVYKLAFKAQNEVAEKFQDWLAIEVIPSIRKHGTYMTPETIEKVLLNPDTIIKIATQLKEEQQKRIEAEQTIEKQKPLVLFANTCMASNDSILVRELAKLASDKGIIIGEKRLYKKLREWGLVIKGRTEPTQRGVESGYFEVIQRAIQTPQGSRISRTTKITTKGQVYIIEKLKKQEQITA